MYNQFIQNWCFAVLPKVMTLGSISQILQDPLRAIRPSGSFPHLLS